jgi:hypothetical protein
MQAVQTSKQWAPHGPSHVQVSHAITSVRMPQWRLRSAHAKVEPSRGQEDAVTQPRKSTARNLVVAINDHSEGEEIACLQQLRARHVATTWLFGPWKAGSLGMQKRQLPKAILP